MGFSQELKDFAVMFKLGQSAIDTDGLTAEERKAKLDLTKAQTQRALREPVGRAGRAIDPGKLQYQALQREKMALEIEALKNKKTAVDPYADVPEDDAAPSAFDDVEPYDPNMSKGGAVPVKSYAEGGVVDDTPEPAVAVPGMTVTPPKRDTTEEVDVSEDDGSDAKGKGLKLDGATIQMGHEAALAGLQANAAEAGLLQDQGVETPESNKMMENYVAGGGAPDPDQVKSLDKVVDPDNKYSAGQRQMLKLAKAYEFYINKGENDKATKAAADLLKSYTMYSNRWKAVGEAAAEKGDVDDTIEAIVRYNSYVPDGRDIQLSKEKDGNIKFSYTDETTGRVIQKGMMKPEELLSFVTKGGMRTLPDLVVAAAGERYQIEEQQNRPSEGAVDAAATGKPDYNRAKSMAELNAMTGIANSRADDARHGKERGEDVERERAKTAAERDTKAQDKKEAEARRVEREKVRVSEKDAREKTRVAEKDAAFRAKHAEEIAKGAEEWSKESPADIDTEDPKLAKEQVTKLPLGAFFVNPKDGAIIQKLRY